MMQISNITSVLTIAFLTLTLAGAMRVSAQDSTVIEEETFLDKLTADDEVENLLRKYIRSTLPTFSPLTGERRSFAPIRYDRVDGLFLGLGGTERRSIGRDTTLFVNAGFGYGFASHYWQVHGGLDVRLFGSLPWATMLGFNGALLTDTDDEWKLSTNENSAFAFLAREDQRNYYKRSGWGIHLEQFLNEKGRLAVEYRNEQLTPMSRRTNWALFGGSKEFRSNTFPDVPFEQGSISWLRFSGEWNSTFKEELPPLAADTTAPTNQRRQERRRRAEEMRRGWSIGALAEVARGDFRFERYTAHAKLFLPLSSMVTWNSRVRIETINGNAPLPFLATVGGVGTLHGHSFNSFFGNRMALVQTEVVIRRLPPLSILGLSVIVFADIAAIGTSEATSPLQGFGATVGQSSVGLALGSMNGNFRIGFARPLNDQRAKTQFVLRFAPVF